MSLGNPPKVLLPYIQVQPEFLQVRQDIVDGTIGAEDCWVSCYKQNEKSVHGKVRLYEGEQPGSVELESREGIQVEMPENELLYVSASNLQLGRVPVHLPLKHLALHIKGIDALDISPDGTLFVAGSKDGWLQVGKTSTGTVLQTLKGHVGDITNVKFFPSGEVILSASIDFSLRVFSAVNGSNPRTLKGHTRMITTTQIVRRGRFVVSGSLDGTVRIWDVGQEQCVKQINFSSGVMSSLVIPIRQQQEQEPPSRGDHEGDFNWVFKDCFILAGLANGKVIKIVPTAVGDESLTNLEFIDTKISKFGGITTMDYNANTQILAIGNQKGTVSLYRDENQTSHLNQQEPIKTFAKPLLSWSRTIGTNINSITINSDQDECLHVYIASADGLPYQIKINKQVYDSVPTISDQAAQEFIDQSLSSKKCQITEFGGIDNDPVQSLKLHLPLETSMLSSPSLFAALDNGNVLKYKVY